MPRAPKNQWDFGDLFAPAPVRPTPPTAPVPPATPVPPTTPVPRRPGPTSAPPPVEPPSRKVFSVTELTLGIKRQLEQSFGAVLVSGEVSNLRVQSSGHAYFVLKDAQAQLSCVLFRGQAGAARGGLRDGARVTLGGELTVYEPRGQYQLRVTSVELEGIGALQAAFERLKARLAAEGLFEAVRKRPFPEYPRRVGLITSPTGAAVRDVLHVVTRRYAGLEFIFVPVRVQGAGAAEEIAVAIALLNEWSAKAAEGQGLDAILVTRGGGSLEDLWAFNEEVVARALAASAVPVISAVGHEIDFTIADFVADLRAATPSAAAELLTQAYVNSRSEVAEVIRRSRWLLRRRLQELGEETGDWQRRLMRLHPRRQLDARAQRLDEALTGLQRIVAGRVETARRRWEAASRRLLTVRPSALLSRRQRELLDWRRRLPLAAGQSLRRSQVRIAQLAAGLRLLSPQKVLDRGYSITFDAASGQVVRRPAEVKSGRRLRTRLAEGEVESVVTASEPR